MKIISENSFNAAKIASQFLKKGKLISFATDTVYGVACDAENEEAVSNLYELKNRNSNKPIAIFLKDVDQIETIFDFDETSKRIASNFLPGALTIVAPIKKSEDLKISKKLYNPENNYLGFRIVGTKFIQEMMSNFNGILAVSSANISGFEAAKNTKDVEKYFKNSKLDLIISGQNLEGNIASTVIKISNKELEILRKGAIPELEIKKFI